MFRKIKISKILSKTPQNFSSLLLLRNIAASHTIMEVLVLGSANVDLMCYAARLPQPGETISGSKFVTGLGGKGANQCIGAARLGAKTAMIAKLGDDIWGNEYLKNFRKEGVNIDFVEQCKNVTTGIAQICVADGGENHIVIVAGANKLIEVADVTKAKAIFDTAKILICQLETPIEATLFALRNFRGISIMNAAPALADTPKDLIQKATIFCVNENEAAMTIGSGSQISNLAQAKKALIALLNLGANTVIITLGALGAVYVCKEAPKKFIHVKGKEVKVVDTTGAGDVFIGSLAYLMARYPGRPMHQYIGGACQVSAHSVQFEGTQTSYPTLHDVETTLDEYKWQEIETKS